MYPIKYIDDNLVFNHEGECYAYYELLPYNYSFLSPEEKLRVQESFQQLVAQNRDGKIHALQISAEDSMKEMQERTKKEIKGRLKSTAVSIIDNQTEALSSMIGDVQIQPRYFIGFKLLLDGEEIRFKDALIHAVKDFVYDVNHHLMGDFVSMDQAVINRYQKRERLLHSKISRRFRFRRLTKNDFGYLIEHLHGKKGVAYEDYEYHLDTRQTEGQKLIKHYDLIKPSRALIHERPRCLEIRSDSGKVHVAYLTIDTVVGELDFPSSEIFYYHQQVFDFPVDVSMNIEILPNRRALSTVRNKKKELKDLDSHAWESNNETGKSVLEALEVVDELEDSLDATKEAMYKLSYVVRVEARTEEELVQHCEIVRDVYDDMSIKLVRPYGDMLGLQKEFYPAGRRHLNDYIQYVTSDFLGSLGFGAAQILGDSCGFYIGYNVDTGQNVYLRPWLAAQGIEGTTTNALASAFTGALGGGKSLGNNLVLYYSVLFGAQALIIDPKSERGKWKETLPEIADEINIVNLTSGRENTGLLDPFVLMQNTKDAESLAIDILTYLTGISSRDSDKFPVLRRAVRQVAESETRRLLCVIDALREQGTQISAQIAEHIDSFRDYDFASLLFSNGNVRNTISLDNMLNIIQVADLVLPDTDAKPDDFTTMEVLSVAMLIVLSTFALTFIKKDRSVFKIVDLDEAWTFLQVAQGKALSKKLVRAGRSMNAGVYFVTQQSGDLLDEKIKNLIGLRFAFRSTDTAEIKNTLEFLGVDKEDEHNQKRLRELENGQCLMRDIYGRVGVIKFHPVFEELLHAFDTRPPQRKDEDENEEPN